MTTHFYHSVKAFVAAILGFLNSMLFYFMPIHQLIALLFGLFVCSYLVGMVNSIRNQMEDISKTKTFRAVLEFTVYTVLIAGFFIIGERMRSDAMMIRFIEIITWGLIYIYITNIFKNLTRLMPYAKGLKWIYFVLNLEFMKRIPQIKDFETKEKNDGNK